MNLKVRVSTLILAGSALVLSVGGFVAWRKLVAEPKAERAALDEGLDELEERAKRDRSKTPRFVKSMYSGSSDDARRSEQGEGLAVPQVANQGEGDPWELGPDEAVASFQRALEDLEAALDLDRPLTRVEQDALYNRATGSFEAMSNYVDGSSPDDRALMEDAYLHMKTLMAELRLERPAFEQAYDHHHPTRAPLPEGARPRRR